MLTLIIMALREIRDGREQIRKGNEVLSCLDNPIRRRRKRYTMAGGREEYAPEKR